MHKSSVLLSFLIATLLVSEPAPAAQRKKTTGKHAKVETQKSLQRRQQEQAKTLANQQAQLEAVRQELNQSQQALSELQEAQNKIAANLASLASRAETSSSRPVTPTKPSGVAALSTTSATPSVAPPQPPKPPEVATLFNQPGVLTPKNALILEPGIQFTHSNSDRVVLIGYTIIPSITVGLIDIRNVTRDATMATLSARYGISHRLELSTRIPYIHRNDTTATRTLNLGSTRDQLYTQSGQGLGDIEVAARYQLNQPTSGPFYITGLRIKARNGSSPFDIETDKDGFPTKLATGSGFWGVEANLGFVLPSDPAVFFGSAGYFSHIKRRYAAGVIDPGDTFIATVGMGIGLNEKASFSVGYEHDLVGKNRLDGNPIADAQRLQLGTLSFGFAYRVSPKTTFNLSLGVGVTTEAPDVQIGLRLPFTL